MSRTKTFHVILFATCLFFRTIIDPVASAPAPEISKNSVEERQSPLTPSQFSLAATRFIVLLPFLPLLMLVPGVTGVLMPMFLALQDRLTTIVPNLNALNLFGNRPGSNTGGAGSVSNQGVTVTTSTEGTVNTTDAPTVFRFKRAFFKIPTEKINDGFREVFDTLYKADDVLNLVTSEQPDCRRQAVCRLHHEVDPSIGTFLGNLIEVLKLESKVEKLDISDFFKVLLKEILQAANAGLFRQDCSSVYSKCSVVIRSRRW